MITTTPPAESLAAVTDAATLPVWTRRPLVTTSNFLPFSIMSNNLTIREKEHWKDRISARIDKRIDALSKKYGRFMERIRTKARERVLLSYGLLETQRRVDKLQKQHDQLKQQTETVESQMHQLVCEMLATITGVEVREIYQYGARDKLAEVVANEESVEIDAILAESAKGRKILTLKEEKEHLLDTVWLATSGKQIKELWRSVEELLGEKQTKLQQGAMAIEPVEDE